MTRARSAVRSAALLLGLALASRALAGNAFFVSGKVAGVDAAAGEAARWAGAAMVREGIPGEAAAQVLGPDPAYPGRLLYRPSYGAFFLTDVGSQWASGIATGQRILAIAEAVPGRNGWTGQAHVGWAWASVAKPDLVASFLQFPDSAFAALPAPALVAADEAAIVVSVGAFALPGASGYSLWRRQGSQPWGYLSSLGLPAAGSAVQVTDTSVAAGQAYQYGVSVELPWPGGGGAGARPAASGLYVSEARSESAQIWATKMQPERKVVQGSEPTPQVRSDGWEAYPNPATGNEFKVTFETIDPCNYSIFVYLLDGSLVRQVHGQAKEAGWQKAAVGIQGLGSGVYLVHMHLYLEGGRVQTFPVKKLAILH